MPQHSPWPSLTVDSWEDTRDTLHMWLQIIGKVQMVSTSLVNHWWNVSYEISARGLRTRLMWSEDTAFDAEFDFIDHELVLRNTDGRRSSVALAPKTVADFWAEVQDALGQIGVDATIVAHPNEVNPSIPFAQDTEHKSYDAEAVTTFWRQLLRMEQVFGAWRAAFIGKDSPVQLFWGSMDLSVTRFSGRGAPQHTGSVPACPPWVMEEAENRENVAVGFWAGAPGKEGTFYAYVYPEPEGYRDATLTHGTFDDSLGEWVLPYEEVRTSEDPVATLLTFLNETYALAADLGKWDRDQLEINPHRLDEHIYGRHDVGWPGRQPQGSSDLPGHH